MNVRTLEQKNVKVKKGYSSIINYKCFTRQYVRSQTEPVDQYSVHTIYNILIIINK